MGDFHYSGMRIKRWVARQNDKRPSAALISLLVLALNLTGCGQHSEQSPPLNGSPENGAMAITQSGCGSCHAIPGIADADGMVGPPLSHFQRRTIIAGLLPNTPDNLVHWIRHPQSVVPGNAMPDTGLSEEQARDVAAYLYTLR
jgi:cytochrome c1